MSSPGLKTALLCSSLSAALLWLGLPGGGEWWPLLAIALVPLFFLLRVETPGRRFFYGLLAGFLHFVLQIYWIVIVLGRYGGLPPFISVPALVLLCLYMALYIALFLLVGGAMWRRWGVNAIWLLPVLWVGLDWCRSVLFSGFPWMDLGYGLWQVPSLMQTADIFGHYFVTYLAVLCNGLIYSLVQGRRREGFRYQLIGAVLLLLAAVLYGNIREGRVEENIAASKSAVFGLVQGNIDQSVKWSPEGQRHTVQIYLDGTENLLQQEPRPQVVVWPETALPFFPMRSQLTVELQRYFRDRQLTLLTGSPWFEVEENGERTVKYYNSAFLISPEGEIGKRYYKSHLVPFGEYVPLKKMLFFLAPLVEAVGDFTPGKVEWPLITGDVRAGVLICFESIFPGIARDWVEAGANVLVNLTNDAWYGRSSAPRQSMAMSVFRAVETRRSLVRAANTGISGIVDPRGRIVESSEIFTQWAKSAEVPLSEVTTFHSRYGYLFAPFCALLSLVFACFLYVRRLK